MAAAIQVWSISSREFCRDQWRIMAWAAPLPIRPRVLLLRQASITRAYCRTLPSFQKHIRNRHCIDRIYMVQFTIRIRCRPIITLALSCSRATMEAVSVDCRHTLLWLGCRPKLDRIPCSQVQLTTQLHRNLRYCRRGNKQIAWQLTVIRSVSTNMATLEVGPKFSTSKSRPEMHLREVNHNFP